MIPALVELEALLFLGRRLDRRNSEALGGLKGVVRRRRRRLGGIGGTGEHLNDVLEIGGIGLNESGGVRVGFRSGEEFRVVGEKAAIVGGAEAVGRVIWGRRVFFPLMES